MSLIKHLLPYLHIYGIGLTTLVVHCEHFAEHFQLALTLRKTFLYSEFFWSVFSHIRTEYGEIRSISAYLARMQENTEQKNSKDGFFSCSVNFLVYL